MLLYHHPDFALHETKSHPESVARITQVNQMLKDSGWLERCKLPTWEPATIQQCERNHDPAASTAPDEFLKRLFESSEKLANKMKPDLIMLSAGFDAHRLDPVGGLTLEAEHYRQAGKWIAQLANQHCGGKLVSILEGGYHLKHMPECVDAHLQGMAS